MASANRSASVSNRPAAAARKKCGWRATTSNSGSMWMPPARSKSMRRADRRAWGFSLIELLVALAVFSLVALALLNLAGENTRTAVVIEERVLAGVVADNRAIEVMLATPSELTA